MKIEYKFGSNKTKECCAMLIFHDLTMKEYVDFMSFHEDKAFMEFFDWMLKGLEKMTGLSSDSTLTP